MTRLASLALPISVAYSLLFPTATLSQTAYNGFGTYSPSFSSGTSPYTLDSGVQCPTTTLNATAFGGSANGWTDNHFPPYAAAGGGLGSYGAAVGISVPLGSQDLREFCKSFAKSRKEFETARVQADLVNRCRYLISSLGITESLFEENFDIMFNGKEAPLSSFVKCKNFYKLLGSRREPNQPMSELPKTEPDLPTQRFSKEPVIAVPSIPQYAFP